MENEIIKMAMSQGLWAVLFVVLLFYVLKSKERSEQRLIEEKNKSAMIAAEREEKLMKCLQDLSLPYDSMRKDVDEVKADVNEIKGDIKELKGKVLNR